MGRSRAWQCRLPGLLGMAKVILGRIPTAEVEESPRRASGMFCSREMAVSVLPAQWGTRVTRPDCSEVSPQGLDGAIRRQAALGDEVQAHDAGSG